MQPNCAKLNTTENCGVLIQGNVERSCSKCCVCNGKIQERANERNNGRTLAGLPLSCCWFALIHDGTILESACSLWPGICIPWTDGTWKKEDWGQKRNMEKMQSVKTEGKRWWWNGNKVWYGEKTPWYVKGRYASIWCCQNRGRCWEEKLEEGGLLVEHFCFVRIKCKRAPPFTQMQNLPTI